jgi:hypothetical protein
MDEILIEQVTSAHRERARDGRVKGHPAWHDLDAAGRKEAFEATVLSRKLEAALSPQGESTTVSAVLARIRAAR